MTEVRRETTLKKNTRNKADKIRRILEASKLLTEEKGYESVTIRDIATQADISIGLIYKYFPTGKPEIIREIGLSFATELKAASQPEIIDFTNFPEFLHNLFRQTLKYYKSNRRFLAALAQAALQDQDVFESFEELGTETMEEAVKLFDRFEDIDFQRNTNPGLFVAKWSDVTKSILLHHVLYPTPFDSDEELVQLLVKISLVMWNYERTEENDLP